MMENVTAQSSTVSNNNKEDNWNSIIKQISFELLKRRSLSKLTEDQFAKCMNTLHGLTKHDTNITMIQQRYNFTFKSKRVFSQNYQEFFVFNNVIRHLNKRKIGSNVVFNDIYKNGVFLDLGANQPLVGSNTAFFDLCLEWKGLCIEGTDDYDSLWQNTGRTCNFHSKTCLSSKTNQTYIMNGETLSVSDEVTDATENKKICTSLNGIDLMKKHGKYMDLIGFDGRKYIDFISLDIERAEPDFLSCFPFNEYFINAWVIELSPQTRAEIEKIMLNNGYYILDKSQYGWTGHVLDGIFVRRNFDLTEFNVNRKQFKKCNINV